VTTTLFALDIGTRSVVGIILEVEGENYHVADLISIEHKERSMIDGQIHNILSVANVISEIKMKLEVKHGPLKKVSVAAAGRALKTVEGKMDIDISERPLISTEDINHLELAAVQKAQQTLSTNPSEGQNDNYYCVGYSVIHYNLDGDVIGNLIDQTGKSASVNVIATFLPRVVVESLLSALKRSGLEMEALTLEPIAAIQVLIPPSMRRLNVALVDVGAGTSDIAITDKGTVIAYGMVPIAGDEVTEALSSEYLLDFTVAEYVKRELATNDHVVITDILGFEENLPTTEMTKILKPTIQRLAKSISNEIQKLNNGKSPKAVILVGGGSLTPDLPKEISTYLDLPENRVGIRGLEALSGITKAANIGSTPDLVTPIGIAIAGRQAPIHYMSVTVNKKLIRLFDIKQTTIGDALLATNISARQLYGKPGHGMTIVVNGNNLIIPGGHGTASTIMLNGNRASSKDLLKNGDIVELVPGKEGIDATATTLDLFEDALPIHIKINGQPILLEPTVLINNEPQLLGKPIKDRDNVIFSQEYTLSAALKNSHLQSLQTEKTFTIKVDNQPIVIQSIPHQAYLNSIAIKPNHLLKNGDEVIIQKPVNPTAMDIALKIGEKTGEKMTVTFNNEVLAISKDNISFKLNNQIVEGTAAVKPNDRLEIIRINKESIVFSDIFAFTDYNPPSNTSGSYSLLRNDQPIGFNEAIFGGDRLEIKFIK